MTSSEQLTNGNEDPYKSEGQIELKIENLSGFVREELNSQRLSVPICVRGVPWKISARIREYGEEGQKCLGYYLRCLASTDTFWRYSVAVKLNILACKDKEGNVDCVREYDFIYGAEQSSWGVPHYMTFEDLMNPDSGWYYEQSDSITLAVNFTVVKADEEFGNYVLIAQNELKLDKDPTRFSMQIGHMEWEINTKNEDNSLVLTGKDLAGRGVDNKVLLELFGYHRDISKSELYSPIFDEKGAAAVHRHLFTAKDNSLTVKVPGGSANLLFTVRVYKERSQFPDFTKEPTAMPGRNATNVTLRVGEKQFHVNKQLLSALSPFFDRNFNGLFDAAKQHELELSLTTHSPELFHHFLLVLCINEALPNSMNVAALFRLADFYDADNVRQKCDQHIRLTREMPIEKRVLLACDHGSKETRALIMDGLSPEESKRINLLLVEHYCPKR